jgi:uncharacterized protein (DUF1800 family)
MRQIERKDDALPSDPVEHAIYADSMYAYQHRKQLDAADGSVAAKGAVKPAQDDESMMNSAPTKKDGKRETRQATKMDADAVDAVMALPPEQRMAKLVAMSPEQMYGLREGLKPLERYRLMVGMTPQQTEILAALLTQPERVVGSEALESRLERDVYSDRQLQAVMVDFWLNHFSVYARKSEREPYLLPAYERDVVLPNALGNFEQLLVATAKSPAMLEYLDNWESIGPDSVAAQRIAQVKKRNPNGEVVKFLPQGINENYARELMELHTLGVGGGYTQADVIQVARCFTGWTVDRKYGQGGTGEFVFEANRHEGGDKVVLGHTIHAGGMDEGMQVLHILATSPATAKFISTKLAVRFVSDTPPPALVDRMAATFLKTNGDIKAVLTTMYRSPEFWSPTVYRAKVKTPLEFMVSALRASGAQVNNPLPLVLAMERLGMPIYGMQTPNGYSWMASEWVSSNALISRMNFALVLSGDRIPGTQTNWPALLGQGADSAAPSAATEKQLETLLGEPAAEKTRAAVMEQSKNPDAQKMAAESFNAKPVSDADDSGDVVMSLKTAGKHGDKGGGLDFLSNQPETPLDTMAGLLLGSPEFQRR